MKRLALQMEDELHATIKIVAIKQGKTVKDYITELIKKDLEVKGQKVNE